MRRRRFRKEKNPAQHLTAASCPMYHSASLQLWKTVGCFPSCSPGRFSLECFLLPTVLCIICSYRLLSRLPFCNPHAWVRAAPAVFFSAFCALAHADPSVCCAVPHMLLLVGVACLLTSPRCHLLYEVFLDHPLAGLGSDF